MRRSILTEKIARRGRHILQEYTVDPLDLLQAAQLMTPHPQTLSGGMTIEQTLAFFTTQAKHRSYPVVDAEGRLIGLVSRTDALRWQVDQSLAKTLLSDAISDSVQPVAYPDTPSGVVADLIIETGVGRIPIVDRETRKVLGILSSKDLRKASRDRKRVGEGKGESVRVAPGGRGS